MARLVITVLLGAAALLSFGGVAWAHAAGLTSSPSKPVVLGITPPTVAARLTVRPVEFGARLRLDNQSAEQVNVLPLPGDVARALLAVPPGGTAYWSDPRVIAAAAGVRPSEGRRAWEIPMTVGTIPVTVIGEQRWPPSPNAGLWWLVTGVAAGLPAVLVALTSRSGPSAVSRWVLALATAVVIAAHVGHIYGSSLVPAEGRFLVVFLAAAGFAVVGWPIGVAGALLTARGRPTGALLCCVAGALLAIIIAPADVFSFHDAVVPFAWGADLDRLLIALTVGGGLGVLIAAWILMRRTPAGSEEPAEEHRA